MIYNKDAVFSYPILSNSNDSYVNNEFYFNVENIIENEDSYKITFDYNIGSSFIESTINQDRAVLILIIQSKDNKFYEIEKGQKSIIVPKNRISFSDKVKAQLHIQSIEPIPLKNCTELNSFYNQIKKGLEIRKNSLIGYSNVSTVRNTGKQGISLFEKVIDPTLKEDFAVTLTGNHILLKFKNEKFLLHQIMRDPNILNMYLYVGLDRAISQFIEENLKIDEDSLLLEEIDDSNLNNLNYRLYILLMDKGINEVTKSSIDKLVQKIASGIIPKFTKAIERMFNSGN